MFPRERGPHKNKTISIRFESYQLTELSVYELLAMAVEWPKRIHVQPKDKIKKTVSIGDP